MAEGILKRMLAEGKIEGFEVRSAGAMAGGGSPASEEAVSACRDIGVDLSTHRSTRLTADLVSWADLILCMENRHAEMVVDLSPTASAKTHLLGEFGPADGVLEVPDPIGMPLPGYRECRDHLFDSLRGLLGQLPQLQTRWETIVVGCDASGIELKKVLLEHIKSVGRNVLDCGPSESSDEGDDLGAVVDVGRRVGGRLARFGILVGISGIGMSIAANKIPGVRAALCANPEYAVLARELHDANVLCLGSETLEPNEAIEIVDAWLAADYLGDEDDSRVNVFKRLEFEFSGR